jgi:signal transduction histidine kinase/CheY-like chemotaxis protein
LAKDGRAVTVEGNLSVHFEAGVPVSTRGIFRDVSAQKRIMEELAAAKNAAERANRAKSEFLSSMSHELRTPMNAILGFAQMLEYDNTLSADQQDNVQEILKGGRHLLELINEVLDLAKIESGRIDLSLEPVNLAGLVEDCRPLIQTQAGARRISLFLQVPKEAAVRADRTRLKQVLLNVLSNAVKYNREGGDIRLGVQAAAGGRLRITVADTGVGIAPERMEQLFQPFNRLDAEHSAIEGTGIGLTITRQLVELMGGEVGVDSEVGVSSSFWMELPSEATTTIGTVPEDDGMALQAAMPTRLRHVLCIDDNPVNLNLITKMLGVRQHIRLVTAHTPRLGIELALAHHPDLILLDINMPGMDGYQVLEAFKADAHLKGTPVIAVTANAMSRDIERGRAAGFTDYLTKPLDIEQFLKTIDRYLGRSEEAVA